MAEPHPLQARLDAALKRRQESDGLGAPGSNTPHPLQARLDAARGSPASTPPSIAQQAYTQQAQAENTIPVNVPFTDINVANIPVPNAVARGVIGAGQAVMNTGQGLRQLLGGMSEPEQQQFQAERDMTSEALGTAGTVGNVVGDVAMAAALPGIGAIPSATGRLAAAAALGGAEQGAKFVGEDESRAMNVGLGAGFGAAGGAAGEVVGRGINTLMRRGQDPARQQLQQLGDQFGVRISATDASTSKPLAVADTLSENVPLTGMGSFRMKQNQEARAAAQRFLDEQGFSGDIGPQLQQSIQDRISQVEKRRNEIYSQLWDDADNLGGRFNMTNTQAEIRAIAQEISGAPGENPKLIDRIINRFDMPDAKPSQIDTGRKIAESEAEKAFRSGDNTRGIAYKRIADALRQDLDEGAMATGNSQIIGGKERADDFFKDQVLKVRDDTIKRAVRDGTSPDIIYNMFIRSVGRGQFGEQGSDQARKLFNVLDDRGKSAVRYGMVRDALEQASVTSDSGAPVFSPAKFAQSLNRIQGARDVFFSGVDQERLNGLVKLMESIPRAGRFMENPPTGQRLSPLLMGGAGADVFVTGGTTVAAPLAGAGALRVLLTTRAGKRLLSTANRISVDSPQWQRLTDRFNNLMASAAATGAAE